MRNWILGAGCALGLAALLAVPALGAAAVPVKDYAVPVDLSEEGAVWCARYDDRGKMLSLAESADPAADAPDGAASMKIFQLNPAMEPLAGAQAVYFTGWRERQQYGDLQAEARNYAAAAEAYTQAIALDGAQALPYVGRGDARILGGAEDKDLTADKLAASQADYAQARENDPACAGAWLGLADVSIRTGNIDGEGGAKAILEEGLTATGRDPRVQAKLEELNTGGATDSSGLQHRRTTYDGSGTLLSHQDFTYDAQGRRSSVTSYNGAGFVDRIDFLYDETTGRPLNGYGPITSTGELLQIWYQYDASGNVLEEREQERVDGQWQDIQRYTYTYYDTGKRETAQRYLIRNGVEEREESEAYFYDEAGRQIRRNVYRANGELYWYLVEDYDEAGRHTKHTEYGLRDGAYLVTSYTLYFYDESGKLVRSEDYVGGELKYVKEYS